MWKYLTSIFLLALLPRLVTAQKDTTKLSFKRYYIPTGIRVGTDLIALGKSRFVDTYSGWEANLDVDFHRYYLAVDYGSWARDYNKKGDYSNDGNYYRIGADVNFLMRDPDRNLFFLGARYGHSVFSEQYIDPEFGKLYTNTDVPASWFELTTGLKVKIWEFIWLGYTARFKFGLKTGETPEMLPHDVPGYGRTDEESYWGFNYQIFFRIPVRKAPPPLPPKKKKKR